MQKLISKYRLSEPFEQSGYNSPEFLVFAREFKKEFSKELAARGCKVEKFMVGHFYISGFFRNGEQLFYFSWSNGSDSLMYRTAKDLKGFAGGHNQWVRISEDMVQQMRVGK